jgi:hypothetical protein
MGATTEKLGAKGTVITIAATLFGTNWLCARYLNFPFAWCWGRPVIQPIVEPWMFLIHFLALIYLCVATLKLEPLKIASALMVCVMVFGLPTFMEILFRLGKSCS